MPPRNKKFGNVLGNAMEVGGRRRTCKLHLKSFHRLGLPIEAVPADVELVHPELRSVHDDFMP